MNEHGQAPRWICTRCGKNEIPPDAEYCDACTDKPKTPLGGALFLPLAWLFLTLGRLLPRTAQAVGDLIEWGYDSSFSEQIFTSVLIIPDMLILIATGFTLILFLRHSRRLPACYIALLVFSLVLSIVQAITFAAVFDIPAEFEQTGSIMVSAVFTLAGICYFRMSERVKKTFTR